jgi:hypothetical protein
MSANGSRQSRPGGRRPPRPAVSSGRERDFSSSGRDRDFPGSGREFGNGEVAEVASSAAAMTEDADALMRKLRQL